METPEKKSTGNGFLLHLPKSGTIQITEQALSSITNPDDLLLLYSLLKGMQTIMLSLDIHLKNFGYSSHERFLYYKECDWKNDVNSETIEDVSRLIMRVTQSLILKIPDKVLTEDLVLSSQENMAELVESILMSNFVFQDIKISRKTNTFGET